MSVFRGPPIEPLVPGPMPSPVDQLILDKLNEVIDRINKMNEISPPWGPHVLACHDKKV